MSSSFLTLGYAGSVAYGYGEALIRLIPVLHEVGVKVRMFSPKPTGILDPLNYATDVVEICGYRPALEAWEAIKVTCDAVILPYSNPAGKYELLYRTHFPSKLTEYLTLGMPVIVSGPVFATGMQYARAEKLSRALARQPLGKRGNADTLTKSFPDFKNVSISEFLSICPNGAVPCTTREELVDCLARLKTDGELRWELASRAVVAGKRDFDPSHIREAFWARLKTARP